MTCKDCVHYKACMHTRTAILDPYQACPSDKDTEECSDWLTTNVQEVKHEHRVLDDGTDGGCRKGRRKGLRIQLRPWVETEDNIK